MNLRKLMTFCVLSASVVQVAGAVNTVIVDKPALMLYVTSEKGDTLFSAPVAVGRNFGDKQRSGDCRTPEGTFSISKIHDSSGWYHDAHDGRGSVRCYGPLFFRIKHPRWYSIGIHGTDQPGSVGTRASEGCVRLSNDNILKLRNYVGVGSRVIIHPDNRK